MWIEPLFEICAVLGGYVAYSGSFLLTFRDSLAVPSLGVKQSKNTVWRVKMRLPFYAVQNSKTAQISFTPRRKTEITRGLI
jgi:hypothetical protein